MTAYDPTVDLDGHGKHWFYVRCVICHARTDNEWSSGDAIETWNRRAYTPEAQGVEGIEHGKV